MISGITFRFRVGSSWWHRFDSQLSTLSVRRKLWWFIADKYKDTGIFFPPIEFEESSDTRIRDSHDYFYSCGKWIMRTKKSASFFRLAAIAGLCVPLGRSHSLAPHLLSPLVRKVKVSVVRSETTRQPWQLCVSHADSFTRRIGSPRYNTTDTHSPISFL